MQSIGMAMKLRLGCYEEYKLRHDNLWPDLAEAMHRRGISMVIYRFEDHLFVYGTAPSQQSWDEMKADPITPRWNRYMAEVVETDASGNIIFIPLPQAFAFGDLS
jgi:L-rhamnose mutarotase